MTEFREKLRRLAATGYTAAAPELEESYSTLQHSEHELADFFDNASIGLHWVGADGTILRVNRAELQMLGYDHDQYVGHNIAEFYVDQQAIQEILSRLMGGETVRQFPAEMRCRDGSVKNVLINSSGMWEEGRFVHSRCFTLDMTDSKWAEGSKELAAAIVTTSDDAILSKSLDGTILSWNPAAERLFGYSADEAVGKRIDLIIPRELLAEEERILRKLRAGEHIDHFETVRVAKGGQRLQISLSVAPVRNAAGQVVGASSIARDMSERRRTEEALRASEERYRALVESQAEMLCRFRPDGTILYANPAYARSLDTTPETLLEGNFWNFVPESDRASVREMLDRLTPQAPEIQIENRFNTADGERWILWTNRALAFDESGRLTEAQSTGVDITGRRRAEEALRESERRFKDLANNIDQFAWTCDELGQATWYNRRWHEYTGTDFDSMAGEGWRAVHHPDHVERVHSSLMRAVRSEQPWEETFPLRGKDGQYRWFLSRAVPIRDADGRVIRWFGTNTDITELRELAQALRTADRRKDEFLATLSHELRNPLAPIANSLELLRQADDDPKMRASARDAIARQVSHLVRLVDDLLDVSRITRDRLELRLSRVDLGSVIRQAAELRESLPETGARKIECRLPDQAVVLEADPVRLAQILNNLINNACKFSAPDGIIRVTAELQGCDAVISVRDYGAGIPEDRIEKIFEMFTHYDPPVRSHEPTGGLGIGLALTRRLVELHGGRIEVHSEGPGKGSEFVVRMPAMHRTEEPDVMEPVRPVSPANGRRILVVDDNVDNAESLSLLLRFKGFETAQAFDGEDALAQAQAFKPHVILLDIGLPKLDGREVCRRIRVEPWGRAMKIIAVTGWGQDADRRMSTDAGFDHHLVKPIQYSELEAVL